MDIETSETGILPAGADRLPLPLGGTVVSTVDKLPAATVSARQQLVARAGIALTLGAAAGVGLQSIVPSAAAFALLAAVLAGAAVVASRQWHRPRPSRHSERRAKNSPEYPGIRLALPMTILWLWLAALAAGAAAIGCWRMADAAARANAAGRLVLELAGRRDIRGLVADDPTPKQHTTSLILSGVLVRTDEGWRSLAARVMVTVPHYPEHEYGEYLQLRGKLEPPPPSQASEALARQDVRAEMLFPRVSYLANPQANPVLQAMFRLRHRLGETFNRTLPDPEASTLAATVLGLRSAMDKRQQQALVETGTVHLVVISGFKLSLLAAAFEALALGLLRRLTASRVARALAMLLVLGAIAAYTMLSGSTPSSVRAALMAGVVVAAGLAGRPRDRLTALAIAVLVILLFNPFELWDAGFELSCLSVLGITVLAEPIALRVHTLLSLLRRSTVDLPAVRRQDASHPLNLLSSAISEATGASAAATLFDLPILAGSFHLVSLVSPLANLLGMPLLWPIMVFGGTGAAIAAVFPPIGAPLLWTAWAFTKLLEWLVAVTDAVPHAALPISDMPWWLTAAYYFLLLVLTWWLERSPQERQLHTNARIPRRARWGFGALAAAIAAATALVASRPDGSVRVTFLAVPGEATLIQTAGGRNVLVNGGESGSETERQLGQLLPPWDRTIDLAVATTTRSDRVAGLVDIAGRYEVRRIVGPEPVRPTLTFSRFERSSARLKIAGGQAIDLGDGASLELIYPGRQATPVSRDADAQTMVWRLRLGATSVLFAGRLPPADWPELGAVQDTVVEASQQPTGGQIWIRPIGSETGGDDEDAVDLAQTGNVTVLLRASSAGLTEQ